MEENRIEPEETYAVPVYLFTGFLDAGKTRFIQETLEDERFNTGERTLLIVCEAGEGEYDPARWNVKRICRRDAARESEFTPALLEQWQRETDAERVFIEWNGMWLLDTLYGAMPARWLVYQEFFFADARSFLNYNTNLRQLVYDKLKSCELVVFNRFDPERDITPFHRIVRAANRRCDIAYEDEAGKVRYDETEDPLPFDKAAPVIEIADRDYALWYSDLNEALESYEGKTVRFKAQIATSDELPAGDIIVGRRLMTCCEADIQFAGLIATENPRGDLGDRDWAELTAAVHIGEHPGYRGPGPVLTVREIAPCEPPDEEVASFY